MAFLWPSNVLAAETTQKPGTAMVPWVEERICSHNEAILLPSGNATVVGREIINTWPYKKQVCVHAEWHLVAQSFVFYRRSALWKVSGPSHDQERESSTERDYAVCSTRLPWGLKKVYSMLTNGKTHSWGRRRDKIVRVTHPEREIRVTFWITRYIERAGRQY